MRHRIELGISLFRSQLSTGQQRGVQVLGWLSVGLLVALSVTGTWQFFMHEPDPNWFSYAPDSGQIFVPAPSTGMAALHGFFADAATALTLIGGGWFAYKVIYDIPRLAVIALVGSLVGLITGSLMRFNAVKISGKQVAEAANGYPQLFLENVEYVATDKQELGATAIRILTLVHVAIVPALVGFACLAFARLVPKPDQQTP